MSDFGQILKTTQINDKIENNFFTQNTFTLLQKNNNRLCLTKNIISPRLLKKIGFTLSSSEKEHFFVTVNIEYQRNNIGYTTKGLTICPRQLKTK